MKKYKLQETLKEFQSHFNAKSFPFEFDENGYLLVNLGEDRQRINYKTATINDIKDYVLQLIPDKLNNDTSTFSNRNLKYVDGWNNCINKINSKINN